MVPTLEFAKKLLQRDQRLSITVLLMRHPISPSASSSDTEELAAASTNIRFINLPSVDPPPPQVLKSRENYISVFFESLKPHVKDAIIQHVISSNSDSDTLAGLVLDMFCSSMIDVANDLGVPSYVFFASNVAFLGLTLYLPDRHSKIGREFNKSDPDSIIPVYANPVPSSVLPSFLFNKDGGYAIFVYHGKRFKETKGIFINTCEELESHPIRSLRSDPETPPIYPVGPLLNLEGQIKSDPNRDKILEWLNDQPPSSVVLLCFGNLGGFKPPQLAEIAIALEQGGQKFLWSVRQPQAKASTAKPAEYTDFSEVLPQGFLDRTRHRGLVCGWVPQVEVLAHEAVGGFVSHCGWNSILESLWHGVPIATWPIYAEQQTNAFRLVKELELAVELKLDYRSEEADKIVMADEIEKAIQSLMDAENPVRKRVKEMSQICRKAVMDGGSSFTSIGRVIDDIWETNYENPACVCSVHFICRHCSFVRSTSRSPVS